MIGIIARPGQIATVEEFFELFKTPWELYRQDRAYDVVLATTDHIPQVDARLLLVYGAVVKDSDAPNGIDVDTMDRGVPLNHLGTTLPIYGSLATFKPRHSADNAVVTASGRIAGLRFGSEGGCMIRLGYDLFDEVQFLLSAGQPVEQADIPTLDSHITMLRDWILSAGVPLLEIPPTPSGHGFAVCLTHDIDFVGIRNHRFDHSMWGFVYRSTVGGVREFARRRISLERLFRMWRALASLPLVYLGWAKDFWNPFEWYLRVEKDLPATYFLIPFKRRAGANVSGRHASRRATAYDVGDLPEWTAILTKAGCELGVHGIDAWHSVDKGRDELARIAAVTGESGVGVRMHWLLHDTNTASVLEKAGYAYDSTRGYNETIGYRNGTTQVFRPLDAQSLLELPLHIQDGALFFANRLDLSEAEAWTRCGRLIANADRFGGVLTVLWHDRSHGPERFWGDFYSRLVLALKASNGWFGTASQVVGWFRKRREVRFVSEAANGGKTTLLYTGGAIEPPLRIRLHHPSIGNRLEPLGEPPSAHLDFPWNGRTPLDVDGLTKGMSGRASGPRRPEFCSQS